MNKKLFSILSCFLICTLITVSWCKDNENYQKVSHEQELEQLLAETPHNECIDQQKIKVFIAQLRSMLKRTPFPLLPPDIDEFTIQLINKYGVIPPA